MEHYSNFGFLFIYYLHIKGKQYLLPNCPNLLTSNGFNAAVIILIRLNYMHSMGRSPRHHHPTPTPPPPSLVLSYLTWRLLISCQYINHSKLSTQSASDLSGCLVPDSISRPKLF